MFTTRPGIKLLHRFRANVTGVAVCNDRLLVTLENGKAYRSNLKQTRWYRILPVFGTTNVEEQ